MPVLAAYLGAALWLTATHWQGVALFGWGVILGLISFIAHEYLFHRFLLHLPAPRSPWLRKMHARVHWQHHQTPDKPHWLFVPLWGSVGMVGIAAATAYGIGGIDLLGPALVGYCCFFLHYEATHLAAHVNYKPRTRFGKFMKRYHLLHHFKNERYWFGVTNPLMDLLFGTWPERGEVPKSQTARTLGIEPD
jgi:hypothetical protein